MTLFDLELDRPPVDPDGRSRAVGRVDAAEQPEATAPRHPLRRVLLGVAYDGAGFHGFAAQPGERTVAGLLAEALGQLAGHEVRIVCAGRTDTGVHAHGQVVHIDLDLSAIERRFGAATLPEGELAKLATSLTRRLGPEIVVWHAKVAPEGFDARRSAIARCYRYDLSTGAFPDPLASASSWHVAGPLDLAAMRLASDPLIGEHDFAAFCRRPPDRPEGEIRRRVTDARWQVVGDDLWRFEIEAQAFCHQMVRSIVGMLVAVGRGKWRPSDVVERLRNGDRAGVPSPAPPHGLCLVGVRYPGWFATMAHVT